MSRRERELPIDARRADVGSVVALWLVTIFLLLNIGGFAFYRSGHATVAGNQMSIPRSLFTSVNAATLSGFQQSVLLSSLTPGGQIGTAILMIGGIFLTMSASTIAVGRILRKTWSIRLVLLCCALTIFLATVVGGAVIRPPGGDLLDSMFQAASAFGNCGLSIDRMPGADDARTYIGLLPMAILGSVGLPVLIEATDAVVRGRALSRHSRIVLMMTAAMFLIGFAGCFFLLRESEIAPRSAAASALVASVNSRTAGLPIEYVYDYPRAMQWLLTGLMFIGGAPASAAGGLKVTTLVVLFAGMRRALRNEPAGRAFGIALVWVTTYLMLNFAVMLWLLQSAPEISGDRALFIAVSAVSNTGLSPDPLSITGANGYVLSAAMFAGRFLPIGVLWWMAWTTPDADIAVA